MRSATQILLEHPDIEVPPEGEAFEGPCWLCGGTTCPRGVPVSKWQGSSFTGQTRIRAPHGTHVCAACVFFTSRTSPVPGRPPKPGKKLGGNYRNYSHLYDAGRYLNASKAEKPNILAFLRGRKSGTWFGAIADSGQKHVLPWAPLNHTGASGRVLFDDTLVKLPRTPGGWQIVDDMASLLTAGATKEEIDRGEYGPRAWQRARQHIQRFELNHGAHQRGGGWFVLALWLAQRDEEAVAERIAIEKEKTRGRGKGTTEGGRGGVGRIQGSSRAVPPGGPGRVHPSGGESAQALGADPKPSPPGSPNEREPGRVDDARAEGASAPGREQLDLFGGAGLV